MEKIAYLLYEAADASGDGLRRRIESEALPVLRGAGAERILLCVNDEAMAAGKPIRRSDPPIRAFVTFWMENADDRAAGEEALAKCARQIAGYSVSEARPLVHARAKGQRTPGMNQVTCIRRLPGMDDETFFQIWTVDHKKVAVETQSTTGYVRNVITRALTPNAPVFDAIVEEVFPIEALTSPNAFYAAPDDETLGRNVKRMIESCNRFLDMAPLECTPMSEYDLG